MSLVTKLSMKYLSLLLSETSNVHYPEHKDPLLDTILNRFIQLPSEKLV